MAGSIIARTSAPGFRLAPLCWQSSQFHLSHIFENTFDVSYFFAIAKFYVNHHTSSLILDNEDVWWKKKTCLFAKSIQKTWQRLEKYLESSVLIKFYEIACESIFYLEQLSPLAIQLSLSMFLTKIHSISFLKENVPLKWLDIAYLQHVSSR